MIWYLRDLNDVVVCGAVGVGIALVLRATGLEVTIRRRKP